MSLTLEAAVVKLRETQKSPLTPREAEVLALLCLGQSTKQVAFDMGLSTRTIDHYRRGIMDKMRAESLVHLGCIATARGWV